jgi:hypothetical protein
MRRISPTVRVAIAAAAAVVFLAGVGLLVLAPAGHGSAEDALPEGTTIAARSRADGSDVFVVTSGVRMRLAVGYEDIKGWRISSTPYVARTEPVVWARLSRRGTEVSAVYGSLDGPVPTVVWADGRRQVAERSAASGVYLAVRAGTHECRTVLGVGPGAITYNCND